jgi:uroporphyrinogen-III synthase
LNPDINIIIFTSPSNVEAFFEKNKFGAGQKAVAMGDATKNALLKKGVKEINLINTTSFDDLGLYRAVLHFA